MTQKINNLFEDIEMSFVVANCDFKLLFFSLSSCFAVANCDHFTCFFTNILLWGLFHITKLKFRK